MRNYKKKRIKEKLFIETTLNNFLDEMNERLSEVGLRVELYKTKKRTNK